MRDEYHFSQLVFSPYPFNRASVPGKARNEGGERKTNRERETWKSQSQRSTSPAGMWFVGNRLPTVNLSTWRPGSLWSNGIAKSLWVFSIWKCIVLPITYTCNPWGQIDATGTRALTIMNQCVLVLFVSSPRVAFFAIPPRLLVTKGTSYYHFCWDK